MKRRWTTLVMFLALVPIAKGYGQTTGNMVYNPSFESHSKCPERIDALGVMREADAWWQPTGGSSDYFNVCGGRECSIPRNKMGFQAPHTGEAYCGIYCSQEHYREYLQTELMAPLLAGKRYRVSFWVSLADKSPHAVATLGALLTSTPVSDSSSGILMIREVKKLDNLGTQTIATPFIPQVHNSADSVLEDANNWSEVSGEFMAEGGERFLTIGNFFSFNKSHVIPTMKEQTPLPGAYYYIDDVSVVCLECNTPAVPEETPLPEIGEIIRLNNLYFATDESEVLPQSYIELVKLERLLSSHPSLTIEILGHTDSQGSVEHNQRLSEARAKAVVDYLVAHGISQQRLQWHGYGKSHPVADNDTPEGRQLNRRVEYRVLTR